MLGNKTVLFTIDIKISGRTRSIPIYEGENHQELIKRFCQQNQLKEDYKQAIKDKIIEALLATLNRASISAVLKEKVTTFLSQNDKRTASREKARSKEKLSSSTDTPFRKLSQTANQSAEMSKVSNNRHLGGHLGDSIQKIEADEPRNKAKANAIRKNVPQYNRTNFTKPQSTKNSLKSSKNPKHLDPDLIAAYETIFRKSKQPHLKNLAKRMLQQAGSFSNQRKGEPLAKIQNTQHSNAVSPLKRTHPQPTPSNTKSFKNNHRQSHSLTKYELIQQSNPEGKNRSSSRKRIKYDIGNLSLDQNLTCLHRYTTGEPEPLTKYTYGESSPFQNARQSISYDRLPYNLYPDGRTFASVSTNNLLGRSPPLQRTRRFKYL